MSSRDKRSTMPTTDRPRRRDRPPKPKQRRVRCPECGSLISIPAKAQKRQRPQPGRWKLRWKGSSLLVGRVGVSRWLGTWQALTGQPPGIVPPRSMVGEAAMRLDGLLRANGFYCYDAQLGRYRRAGRADVTASTALGRNRLAAAGWPDRRRSAPAASGRAAAAAAG